MEDKKKKMDADNKALKEDVEDLENALAKADQEKVAQGNQIKTLQDDMAKQEDSIGKLSKEKKNLEEVQQQTVEKLQAEEDKVNHLNKLKTKLEQTLDEVSTFIKLIFMTKYCIKHSLMKDFTLIKANIFFCMIWSSNCKIKITH